MTFGTIVICGGGCYGGYYLRQLVRATAAGAIRCERVLVVDQDPDCRVARLDRAIRSGDRQAVDRAVWRTLGSEPTPVTDAEHEAYAAIRLEFRAAAWAPFFDTWFAEALAEPERTVRDAVVPSPLMPHLLADWVATRLQHVHDGRPVRRVPLSAPPETPWQRQGGDGSHYASFATWMCPINCIEPARCPETRGLRDWCMPVAVAAAADRAVGQSGRAYDVVSVFQTTHRVYGVGMFDVRTAHETEAAIRRTRGASSVRVLVGSVSHCHGALAELVIGA